MAEWGNRALTAMQAVAQTEADEDAGRRPQPG